MRLYDEIFKTTDGATSARCILLPGGGGYFEGVKCVEELSSQRIVLCFSRRKVEIEGEELSISKYCDGDLAVGGRIFLTRTLGVGKGTDKEAGKAVGKAERGEA